MKEPIIAIWCDPCHKENGAKVSGYTVSIQMVGKKATVDVCELHDKQLFTPLREALKAHGRRPGAAPPPPTRAGAVKPTVAPTQQLAFDSPVAGPDADGGYTCPSCGRYFKDDRLLCTHIYSTEKVGRDRSLNCSICNESFSLLSGANSHRKSKHGYSAVETALRLLAIKMEGVKNG